MSSARKHDNRHKKNQDPQEPISMDGIEVGSVLTDSYADNASGRDEISVSGSPQEYALHPQDVPMSSSSDSDKDVDLVARIKKLEAECDEWKDKAYRFGAEVQNLSKQSQIDIAQARKSTKKSIVAAIASFFNAIHLSFSYVPNSDDTAVKTFVEMLRSSFEQARRDLSALGVEVIIPAVGETFNPEFMEMLNPEALNSESQPVVKQVVSVGLRIDGQLVQSVSVIV